MSGSEKSEPDAPAIGYSFSVRNDELDIDWYGFPREILEELDGRGLDPSTVLSHLQTGITARRVRKDGPDLEFSGGPFAEVVMNLMLTVEEEDIAKMESILERNPACSGGEEHAFVMPLLMSVVAGFVEGVRVLARRNVGLNHDGGIGMTPLHWAAALGKKEIVEILLDSGADCKRLSWAYATPAELASLNGHKATEKAIAKRTRSKSAVLSPELVVRRMSSARKSG